MYKKQDQILYSWDEKENIWYHFSAAHKPTNKSTSYHGTEEVFVDFI